MKESIMYAKFVDITFIAFETWNDMLWLYTKVRDHLLAKIAAKDLHVRNG